jgi:predicted transcriptional regulator
MKELILKLRSEGKSYNQIVKELNCSKSLISYYCKEDSKSIIKKSKENRKNGIYVSLNKPVKKCLNCDKELSRSLKYCSQKCNVEHKHIEKYNHYLDNQELYNVSRIVSRL